MKTYWVINNGIDVFTRRSEPDVLDALELMAEELGMWGGFLIEGTEVQGFCDGGKCDVCDGHLIGWVRKYVEA